MGISRPITPPPFFFLVLIGLQTAEREQSCAYHVHTTCQLSDNLYGAICGALDLIPKSSYPVTLLHTLMHAT